MNIEIEEDIFENDDEIEPGGETTEEANHTILDFRRKIERLFELKQLRELIDEPDLEDIL
jgi:predicted RNA-binding Zn ribbon-like protein